jgi:predicted RNA-binding protein YlxR (DUF448 family)
LIRIVRTPEGGLAVGRSLPGRGAWLCATTVATCAATARRRRAFDRALRAPVRVDAIAALAAGAAEQHRSGVDGPSMKDCSAAELGASLGDRQDHPKG